MLDTHCGGTQFSSFFGLFMKEKYEKWLKRRKKSLKTVHRIFGPAFRCGQHPKAGQKAQQISQGNLI